MIASAARTPGALRMSLTSTAEKLAKNHLPAPLARAVKRVGVYPRYLAQRKRCRAGFLAHGDRYPQKLLFVAGLPKSGTTWLERMLSDFPGFSDLLIPDVASFELRTGGSHDYELPDNLFSRFGLIMLIGLVAKNGILIVEFANQLQVEQGKNAVEAAFGSATIRFRPILMTSISTILGAVPIAFASGAGAETRNPMGLVVVGGLTLSTVITLYVIPIVYVLMDRICVRLTGRNSAHGLKRAEEIAREVAGASGVTQH